jgi:hypothetical protein
VNISLFLSAQIKLLNMKRNIFILVIFSVFSLTSFAQQGKGQKNNPAGTWKFEAPYAPEGYTTGTIIVGNEEKRTTATMSFTGNEYKIPGEDVKAVKDSIFFSVYLQGQDVKVMLKMDTEIKMSGKAVYSEGEVPLTLNKVSVSASDAEAKK